MIYAFVETLPRELDEAAIMDGCDPLRLFFSVIYPLLTPVLVTAAVLNLLGIWNEFLLPLYYLNRSTYWPMTLAVYNFFGQFQSDWSLVSADVLLTIDQLEGVGRPVYTGHSGFLFLWLHHGLLQRRRPLSFANRALCRAVRDCGWAGV